MDALDLNELVARIDVAEQAVRAASNAQAALLRTIPSQTADAAINALRDLLIALGDTAD